MKEKNIILTARIMSMIFTPFYLPMVGLIALFIFSYMSLLPIGTMELSKKQNLTSWFLTCGVVSSITFSCVQLTVVVIARNRIIPEVKAFFIRN